MPVGAGDSVAIRFAYARKASPFGVVVWSPDGRSVAAASGPNLEGDGVVWLWRRPAGRCNSADIRDRYRIWGGRRTGRRASGCCRTAMCTRSGTICSTRWKPADSCGWRRIVRGWRQGPAGIDAAAVFAARGGSRAKESSRTAATAKDARGSTTSTQSIRPVRRGEGRGVHDRGLSGEACEPETGFGVARQVWRAALPGPLGGFGAVRRIRGTFQGLR